MRFKGFDLNLLVALDALLTERSVSRAAGRLNLTQPAASAALGRLRAYFNDDILILSGKRMLPTPHAESLGPVLHDVLQGIEKLVSASTIFDPAASHRRFRVCASDYVTTVLLAPLLPRMERDAPGVSIQIVQPSTRVSAQFHKGEMDLLIGPEEYVTPEHPAELLFVEQHVVVGWAENPELQGVLTEEAFLGAGHVAVELADRTSTFAEIELKKLGYDRRVEVVAPFFSAVPSMLPGTMRLAVMHERLARAITPGLPLKIAPLPFPFPLMREMIQFHRSREFDGGLEWLLGLIRTRAAVG